MARSPQYEQGRRSGVKWAVTFLHRRAKQMNDPRARAILDLAADLIGNHGKRPRPTQPGRRAILPIEISD